MSQVDKSELTEKILSWMGRVTSFPVITPYGLARSHKIDNVENRIDPRDEQLCSGGYNEAFVFEYWASYSPRL